MQSGFCLRPSLQKFKKAQKRLPVPHEKQRIDARLDDFRPCNFLSVNCLLPSSSPLRGRWSEGERSEPKRSRPRKGVRR